ncbi:MAG: hypothetical protein FWH55_14450 [Oscillospiraceae bacterium]|nr:hypothetical protein [Oscillospiraceae bacterium]
MKYFLGIDGGASKTQYALCDKNGQIIDQYIGKGCPYRELGVDAVCGLLKHGVAETCSSISLGDITGCCFGMPCYGENIEDDKLATAQIQEFLSPLRLTFQNDVAAAWAGSLAFESGIVMLCGTGSMALGRDIHGQIKRVGGWLAFFSDEGSGYWLGRRTLELFSKQADGRLARGPLYDITREYFSLSDDFDIGGIVEAQYMNSRHNVATLQMLLNRAAEEGDATAIGLYAEGAAELASMIKALRKQMDLAPMSPVSYAGGMFRAGELIIRPLKEELADLDMRFHDPLLTPVDGAILFAVEAFDPGAIPAVREGLLKFRDAQI